MSGPVSFPRMGVPPVPPSPDGALTVSVPCRTSGSAGLRHDVTINADWSLSVPHDLAGERIAAVFGGGVSCLDLVDRGMPAVTAAVCRGLRVGDVPITLQRQGDLFEWGPVGERRGCCSSRSFDTAAQAAAHACGPHVAGSFGVKSRGGVEPLLRAVLQAHLGADRVGQVGADFSWPAPAGIDAAGAGVVVEPTGMAELWDAGVHPDQVLSAHRRLGVRWPLPAISYLALVLFEVDLEWAARGLAVCGDRVSDPVLVRYDDRKLAPLDVAWLRAPRLLQGSLATWLALSHTARDAADGGLRAEWLAAGVPRRLILDLQAAGVAGYSPDQVIELGSGTARPPSGAAIALHGWVQRGWHPEVADLVAVNRLGVGGLTAPSAAAVAELQRLLSRAGRKSARAARSAGAGTELALLVAVYGSARAAARAWRAGRGWRDGAEPDLLAVAREGAAGRSHPVNVSACGQADESA